MFWEWAGADLPGGEAAKAISEQTTSVAGNGEGIINAYARD